MGYTGYAVYTIDGETNTINEWKHDNTEDAMRFAEAIQLARGANVTAENCDLAEGNVYKFVNYRTYFMPELESLHLMSGILGDAISKKYDYNIQYEKDDNSYLVQYYVGKDRALNYCSLDEKTFKEFTKAFSNALGKSEMTYQKIAHKDGIKLTSDEIAKAFRPLVREMVNNIGQSYSEIKNTTNRLALVDTIRDELQKNNKVFMCGRASSNGKKNIVLRVTENNKNSIKTFPYDFKDMTIYSLCLSGEWAGNYEKINKKEDADLLLQANRLIGKSKSMYSSIAKKVAKNLQEGKEASFDIGGGY